jgi:hypothetical protein
MFARGLRIVLGCCDTNWLAEESGTPMPRKQKINLEKVKAALNTLYPPHRLSAKECPECGECFVPKKHGKSG